MNRRGVGVIGQTYLWRNEEDGQQATKLLRQQHAAFVRLVRKAYTYGPNFRGGMVPCEDGEWINVNDLLAALAKRKK